MSALPVRKFDALVVGAGGSGMRASLELAEAGLQVVVGEPSHDVVTKGLAYVTLVPQGADAPPKGHATFVEVGTLFGHQVVAPTCAE